jgi:putative endonuclease
MADAARHLRLGESGEELAAAFLRKQGLAIVDRRVRFARGELDIVARNGREWVFVEVKTRSFSRLGSAVEAMTRVKSRRMGRAVREYVARHRLHDAPMRCDLVAIDVGTDGEFHISHYPGAIIPD